MSATYLLRLTQLAIGCALLASSALYVHYLDPVASDFCGLNSGCEAVRRSPLAYFGSRFVSLPLFSLIAYGALLLLSLRCGGNTTASAASDQNSLVARLKNEPHLALFAASGFGGLCALALVAYQALGIGHFCWLCLIVDGAAITAALSSFALAWTLRPSTPGTLAANQLKVWPQVSVVGAALLLVAGPMSWSIVQPPAPVPAGVSALYVPGKINIVEFADFECPYCRKLHAVLAPLVNEYGDEVNFVRLNRPLDRHPMAKQAAHAALCAIEQSQGEPMADRLFHDQLSPASISKSALAIGLDMHSFNACLLAPSTTAKLQLEQQRLSDDDFKGLPTTYIGQKLLIGVRSEAAFRSALDKARLPPVKGISGTLFTGLWLLLIGLAWIFPRFSRAQASID